MLETKCVGDKFEMLVTDLINWENHHHNEEKKSYQHNDFIKLEDVGDTFGRIGH